MYNTFPISISMDKPTLDALDALAHQHGLKRSPMIRQLINEALNTLVEERGLKRLVDHSLAYETEAR